MSDDESHDTSHDTSVESASDFQEHEQVGHENLDIKKAKLFNTLSPMRKLAHVIKSVPLFYAGCTFAAGAILCAGFILSGMGISPKFAAYRGSEKVEIEVSQVLMWASGFIGLTVLIDSVIYYGSVYLLERVDVLTMLTFHASGISTHVALFVNTLAAVLVIRWRDVDCKIMGGADTGISAVQILGTCLIALGFIVTKDVVVRNIRMGFNHTNYLSRIQRCLLEQQFIRTLEVVKRKIKAQKTGKRKSYWVFSHGHREQGGPRESSDEEPLSPLSPSEGSGHAELHVSPEAGPAPRRGSISKDRPEKLKPRILVGGQTMETGTRHKMIIFREFERLMNMKLFQKESPSFSTDVKNYAKRRASKIYRWLNEDKKRFVVKNLKKYVDAEYVDTLTKYLGIRDSQVLTEQEIFHTVERCIRERYAIKKSLVQMERALMRVSRMATVVILAFAIIALYSSSITKNEMLMGVMTTFFGAGFIFQSSAKNAIDSIIFLFLVHPYDIGDRVYIELEKDVCNMVVSELNVFSTIFYRWDGAKVYIPNHVLHQKSIVNVRRSGPMAESVKLQIDFDTSTEKLQHLKNEIGDFIKRHPKDFTSYFMFNYEDLENVNKLHLKVYLQHSGNWQNYEAYLQRKSKFIMFLKRAIDEQQITYYPPVHRVEMLPTQ